MIASSFPPAFLDALLDTLLPGDGTLPRGGDVGVRIADAVAAHTGCVAAIARDAGGTQAFVKAAADRRVAVVAAAEARDAAAFRAFLMPLLLDYYGADAVMEALGWRAGPPQPRGHALPPTDAATWRLLDAVRARGKRWRDAP